MRNVRILLIACLLAVAFASGANARIPRSSAAVAEFKRQNACPINSATRGPCPGYEVDHIVPLCAGGLDTPANMQWLTRQAHREKTKVDVMRCRRSFGRSPQP
ncbi:hypothetical protein C380_18130 [Acidovorax sp. KKS102]|nr:hypothetical protein C380_18130 [Acidovorax sp. KKS102]